MVCRISQLWWQGCLLLEYRALLVSHIKGLAVTVNNSWFQNHVDTSRKDYSFKVQSNYEVLLLFTHRCHYCIIISPIALVRTEPSKVYIGRLSLPLHVIHSSRLNVILNKERTTNVTNYFTNQLQCTILYSLTICLLHYYPRHVSSINMPIFRRKNCIHTASGIFALCNRLHSTLVESSQPVYCADVYRERRYQMLCEYTFSSWRWAC